MYPKIIYVLGSGSSGSTLFSLLLGMHPNIFFAGHMRNYHFLWDESGARQIGTGELIEESSFWNQVKKLYTHYTGREKPENGWNVGDLNAIFRGIYQVSEDPVICDNSHYLRFLRLVKKAGFDVKSVHIVRDPRAYFYSRKKSNNILRVYYLVFRWVMGNIKIFLYGKMFKENLVIKYEDLVANPNKTIKNLVDRIGWGNDLSSDDVPGMEGSLDITNYGFSSNRIFKRGVISVYKDNDYFYRLNWFHWWLVTIISLPGLLIFGYPLSRRGE